LYLITSNLRAVILSNGKTDEENRDNLIFELVKGRYDDEIIRLEKLDDQARALVGSILVGVGFLLGLGSSNFLNERTPVIVYSLYFIGLGCLFTSMYVDFMVLRIHRIRIILEPSVDTLLKKYPQTSYQEVLTRVAAAMENAFDENRRLGYNKIRLLTMAWYFLLIGLTTILVFVAISLLSVR
jgi:hypothetical protein